MLKIVLFCDFVVICKILGSILSVMTSTRGNTLLLVVPNPEQKWLGREAKTDTFYSTCLIWMIVLPKRISLIAGWICRWRSTVNWPNAPLHMLPQHLDVIDWEPVALMLVRKTRPNFESSPRSVFCLWQLLLEKFNWGLCIRWLIAWMLCLFEASEYFQSSHPYNLPRTSFGFWDLSGSRYEIQLTPCMHALFMLGSIKSEQNRI